MTTTTSASSVSGDLATPWRPTARYSRWTSAQFRQRTALAALLLGTAVLYLAGLGASGYANEFYGAAVQAGTKSWKAMFFGSFDSSNFITVDKPPAALWPMELAGRLFGFNAWSMLVPQAIEGVLAVWLLYAAVRRWFGPAAGLLAGALLAITPVAVLMFRFNNPDALMTLLIVAAAYCVTRALDDASTRWLLLAGGTMGFAFLAKGLQPFTVLPALTLGYLVAAPTPLRRRLLQLLAAGGALVAGAGWWLAIVALTPASSRPYIGGSGDNTALGLAFGYNGLSRLSGGDGPGGGGANFSGAAGPSRLLNSLNGGQIAWLVPGALAALVALLVVTRGAPRTDRVRAAAIIWGGWLLMTGAVLSFATGIIHTYYSVELAPAVAALVATGAATLWRKRDAVGVRLALAAGAAVTGWWAYTLLHRTASWHPWIGRLVLVAGLLAGALLLVRPARLRRAVVVAVAAALVAIAAGPAAYAVNTAATAHTGSTPSAGPSVPSAQGGRGGFGGPMGGGTGGVPGGAPAGAPGMRSGDSTPGAPSGSDVAGGTSQGGSIPNGSLPGAAAGTGSANAGAPGGGQQASAALAALLAKTNTRWAAATIGSQSAAPLELASGKAVMAIGGFSGTDAVPTLSQFQHYVADGQVAYYVSGGMGGGTGGGFGSGGNEIADWVAAHYTATTVGGTTVYDLTRASTS